jgi:ribosomal-protein-alanine N-acetyltransferase
VSVVRVRGDEALHLGPMRRRDLREVMEVERRVFPEPWSHAVFASELALRRGRRYRTARIGHALVGYAGMMFVDEEAHVTTIGVAEDHRRRGIATTLLVDGLRHAAGHGMCQVSLEVAAGNEAAQSLYRRFGFVPVGIRRKYYPLTQEDALVMWAYEIDTDDYSARLDRLAAQVRSPE